MIKIENTVAIEGGVSYEASALEPVPEEITYDCHGNTCFAGENIYIPGRDENDDPNAGRIFLNESEYTRFKSKEAQEGDVKIFGDPDSGIINHSATRDEDGTYTTKDDRAPIRSGATVGEMARMWGAAFFGVFRHNGNTNGGVESENGEVSEEVAKQAIENVQN